VIFSTHVMQHAERLCNQLLLISRGTKIFDGTLAEAKRTIPRRVLIETASDVAALAGVEGVVDIEQTAEGDEQPEAGVRSWVIRIEESANPQRILEKCFSSGIALSRFDHTEPSLHDVFVALVGAEAARGEPA
jgi:ABC-2 type transport system ATP-binding protein